MNWRVMLLGGALVLAALAAYSNSLSAPFLFDDQASIIENISIRRFWALDQVLLPPRTGSAMTGRPLVNLSLAFNYAVGGLQVRSYHVFNVLLHALSGLTLFGIARRTLLHARRNAPFDDAGTLAFAIAIVWTLHPLLTESVTCVIQRTELIVGFFYLFTLYSFVRSTDSTASRGWRVLAIAACACGMASKEVMVSAPLIVLLYDRTFIAGSFRAAWRDRRRFHLGLAATWLVLGSLLISSGGNRGISAGFGLGVSWWAYALKQCEAIILYLRLALWPHPLVLDYGNSVISDPIQVLVPGLLLLTLITGSLIALWRKPVLGFFAMWLLAILAPSSSVVPLVTQTIAEHRMYLPLAAVIGLALVGIHALSGRRGWVAIAFLTLAFGGLTAARNHTFQDARTIWADTIAKNPGNPRAYDNYAVALCETGQAAAAIPVLAKALSLNPNSAPSHTMMGNACLLVGRLDEAVNHFVLAIRLDPDWTSARDSLGMVLLRSGHPREAIAQFDNLVRRDPNNVEALWHLGVAFAASGDTAAATAHYLRALQIDPNHLGSMNSYADLLAATGRFEDAVLRYEKALQIKPAQPATHTALANVLLQLGHVGDAVTHCEQALALDRNYAEAHHSYGIALFRLGRVDEAISHLEQALRINPNFSEARETLERIRAAQSTPAKP